MPGIKKRIATYKRTADFSHIPETVTRRKQNELSKTILKIPPRHNGIIPIKIKGHTIKGHMAYFISDNDSTIEKDLNINVINAIQNIKGKTSVNILVSHYTNRHITFNKAEYVGHLEPTIEHNEEEKNLIQLNQMPKQQTVLLPNE